MQNLSSSYITGKNKLQDPNPKLLLLKWVCDTETQRFAANASENIAWDGESWIAMPVEIGPIRLARDELPQLAIQVADPSGALHAVVEQYHGAEDAVIDIYCPYYGDLAETTNIPHFVLENVGCRVKSPWVFFTLGIRDNPTEQMDPADKLLKDFCRFSFPNSNDARCPYTGGGYSSCDKTLADCQERNAADAARFGGFPAIGKNRIYV
jgi:phage-related protein